MLVLHNSLTMVKTIKLYNLNYVICELHVNKAVKKY